MRANELKPGDKFIQSGLKRVVEFVIDYSPQRIVVFTMCKCQYTFRPEQIIEEQ